MLMHAWTISKKLLFDDGLVATVNCTVSNAMWNVEFGMDSFSHYHLLKLFVRIFTNLKKL